MMSMSVSIRFGHKNGKSRQGPVEVAAGLCRGSFNTNEYLPLTSYAVSDAHAQKRWLSLPAS